MDSSTTASSTTAPSEALDLFFASQLKGTPLQLSENGMFFKFPEGVERVWIDVGVHAQSDFLPNLDADLGLFVIGLEPSDV